VTHSQIDELVAAVRALPAAEQRCVVQRFIDALSAKDRLQVLQSVTQISAAEPSNVPSMLGLFADEPELVDEVCRQAILDRMAARGSSVVSADSAPSLMQSAQEREVAKQRTREADAHALATGAKSQDELRDENSHFREIAREPIQWHKTRLF
jgi:hypothetical protein